MSPIETTTGLPARRSLAIVRATTSDPKAEPPGLLTRKTMAPTAASRRQSSSASTSVSEPKGQPLARAVGDRAVDEHDGDVARGPRLLQGRGIRRADRDARAPEGRAQPGLELLVVLDGVDEAH